MTSNDSKKSVSIITSDLHRQNLYADILKKHPTLKLAGRYRNRCNIMDSLLEERPDVILTDAMMPFLDIFTFIDRVRIKFDYEVKIIVLVSSDDSVFASKLLKAGADHLIQTPGNAENVLDAVADYMDIAGMDAAEIKLMRLLKKLCLQTQNKGTKYLQTMILLCIENPDRLKCLSRFVYPIMEEQLNVNAANIERLIRLSIQKAWENRDDKVWSQYFNNTMYKPTIKEFVAVICDEFQLLHS